MSKINLFLGSICIVFIVFTSTLRANITVEANNVTGGFKEIKFFKGAPTGAELTQRYKIKVSAHPNWEIITAETSNKRTWFLPVHPATTNGRWTSVETSWKAQGIWEDWLPQRPDDYTCKLFGEIIPIEGEGDTPPPTDYALTGKFAIFYVTPNDEKIICSKSTVDLYKAFIMPDGISILHPSKWTFTPASGGEAFTVENLSKIALTEGVINGTDQEIKAGDYSVSVDPQVEGFEADTVELTVIRPDTLTARYNNTDKQQIDHTNTYADWQDRLTAGEVKEFFFGLSDQQANFDFYILASTFPQIPESSLPEDFSISGANPVAFNPVAQKLLIAKQTLTVNSTGLGAITAGGPNERLPVTIRTFDFELDADEEVKIYSFKKSRFDKGKDLKIKTYLPSKMKELTKFEFKDEDLPKDIFKIKIKNKGKIIAIDAAKKAYKKATGTAASDTYEANSRIVLTENKKIYAENKIDLQLRTPWKIVDYNHVYKELTKATQYFYVFYHLQDNFKDTMSPELVNGLRASEKWSGKLWNKWKEQTGPSKLATGTVPEISYSYTGAFYDKLGGAIDGITSKTVQQIITVDHLKRTHMVTANPGTERISFTGETHEQGK